MKEKKIKKTEESWKDLWDTISITTYNIMEISQEEERKGRKIIWRNNNWTLTKLAKYTNIHIMDANQTPKKDKHKK